MDRSLSIRFCNRARTTERGFALAMALIIAVLYFGLIELMLFDASRELAEARRFRARIVALTLAENGAELAAWHILLPDGKAASVPDDWQGSMNGTIMKNSDGKFTIKGTGDAVGIVEVHATVSVFGVADVEKKDLRIDNTFHSQ